MRGYLNLGKGEPPVCGLVLTQPRAPLAVLLLQNARNREKEDVSLQVEDVAPQQWQVDRSDAGVENGRVERHHGVESARNERKEGDRQERDDSVRFFISPLSSSPPFVPINSPNDDNFFC